VGNHRPEVGLKLCDGQLVGMRGVDARQWWVGRNATGNSWKTDVLRRRREARVVSAEPDGHEPDARCMRHGHPGDDL
jgi:hypothetical protein